MTGDLLDIEMLRLSVHSGGAPRTLLRDVSLSVGHGEVVGLVGESGSGKSLTALSVMGLLPPFADSELTGSITFDGEQLVHADVATMRRLRGSRIALVSQDPMSAFNPTLRIGAQIVEPLIVHRGWTRRRARARAIELLDRVGVRDPDQKVDAYPHEFSGGMLQRAAIAMAISASPQLLLADEPTTALDVSVQAQILTLLKGLCAEDGLAMLMISHDIGVIGQMSDRIAVMRSGEIVEIGPAHAVLTNPKAEYTRTLLDAVPDIEAPPRSRRHLALREASAADERELMRVTGLEVRFRKRSRSTGRARYTSAVHDVSFDVRRGEILGIVGESGSGKSTTARAVTRLNQPISGAVLFDGIDLLPLAPRALRRFRPRLQMVFQDPFSSLNPFHRVERILAAPLRLRKGMSRAARRQAIDGALDSVGLPAEFASRYPHELSGGQRQRLCIAKALILEPELVVCDEALSALDVSIQAQVLEILLRLQRERALTLIFISHDLATVKSVCDRVIVLKDGEVVESGDTAEVLGRPQYPYTRLLLSAVPRPPVARPPGATG